MAQWFRTKYPSEILKRSSQQPRNQTRVLQLAPEQRLTHKEEVIFAQGLKRKILNLDELEDETFDLVYPPDVRRFSQIHWTPLSVAAKASEVLKDLKIERLLDVGSGCGKFCILTGITTDIQITGVEQREFLSSASKRAKNSFRLENVNFINGSAFDLSWKEFDCIYFYNPFCEQKTPERRIRNDVPMNEALYGTYLQLTSNRLREQKKGTKVMTYHGLGTALPSEYSLHYQKAVGSDFLKVWIKTE